MFGVVSVLCCGRQEKLRNTPLHLPRFVGVLFFWHRTGGLCFLGMLLEVLVIVCIG